MTNMNIIITTGTGNNGNVLLPVPVPETYLIDICIIGFVFYRYVLQID